MTDLPSLQLRQLELEKEGKYYDDPEWRRVTNAITAAIAGPVKSPGPDHFPDLGNMIP